MEAPAGQVVVHQVRVGPVGVRVAAALVLVGPLQGCRGGALGQPPVVLGPATGPATGPGLPEATAAATDTTTHDGTGARDRATWQYKHNDRGATGQQRDRGRSV